MNDLTFDLNSTPSTPTGPPRNLFTRHENRWTLRIDNSSLEKFATCARSAEYYLVHGRESGANRSALRFGRAIHRGLEAHYANEPNPIQAAVEEFGPEPVPGDDVRTADRVIDTLTQYIDHYRGELLSPILVEKPFSLPLFTLQLNTIFPPTAGNPTPTLIDELDVYWTGRIDLIARLDNSELWVIDHKTTSFFGPTYWDQFTLSSQMSGYLWAASQMTDEPLAGIMVNAIRSRPPSKSSTGTEMERHRYPYQAHRIPEWLDNTRALVHDFISSLARNFFPQQTQWCVGKFGKCPYFDVCEVAPDFRSDVLSTYNPVTWNPLD